MGLELYDFNEHIDSVEWIYSLPKGLVTEKIDIRYCTVSITELEEGYQVYIAPKDSDLGGDGIMITLDSHYQLTDYVIEKIEPNPFFEV